MKTTSTQIFAAAALLIFLSCQEKKTIKASFESQIIDANVQIGYGIAIGDVDGDKRPDILLADKKQFVWYSNPDWQRFVMVDSLTERDNVCIAARDINGDGKVEVAVGAQWNPGQTGDKEKSGSVHYLIRPENPREMWEPVSLYHEPTIHRMRWLKMEEDFRLIVLPLHGIDNVKGDGATVNVLSYTVPENPASEWAYQLIDSRMHMTHNMDIISENGSERLIIGGKEGAVRFQVPVSDLFIQDNGFGEIRASQNLVAGIQPIHGSTLKLYLPNGDSKVLTDSLKEGHALAWGDFLDKGFDQIVVGWRKENEQKETGIKLFIPHDKNWNTWHSIWIDRNAMATEDLKVADMDGDGKLDIIAAGRNSHNLKIYWNKSE